MKGAYDTAQGKIEGVPAPVRGLNTSTALSGLAPNFAIKLDNWICQPDSIVTRMGAANYSPNLGAPSRNLAQYSSSAVSEMFSLSASGIRNVSVSGVAGASLGAYSDANARSVNFAGSAGQFLVVASGQDPVYVYNGTTWAQQSYTFAPAGAPSATNSLFSVESYRARLYFLQSNYLGFWYLPADQISGTITRFNIGSVCRRGGFAVCQGTWSIDGGSGPDDHYVIATSNGEIVVYRGSDPSNINAWTYFGTFYVGKPLGADCFEKFGGDLLYLCENGLIPLSTLLLSTERNYEAALTFKIQSLITDAVALSRNQRGWEIHVVPRLNLILINVPAAIVGVKATQFVYNTIAKAWSTFSNWDAKSFIEYNNKTYFAQGNFIAEAFTTRADFGEDIVAVCDTSYNRFGTRSQLLPLFVRPLYAATGSLAITVGLAQDFSGGYEENTRASTETSLSIWSTSLWNLSNWASSFTFYKEWLTITARGGLSISTRFKVSSNKHSCILIAFDYKFAPQGLVS